MRIGRSAAPMSDAAYYRDFARRCRIVAHQTLDEKTRDTLLEMANEYGGKAAELDKLPT